MSRLDGLPENPHKSRWEQGTDSAIAPEPKPEQSKAWKFQANYDALSWVQKLQFWASPLTWTLSWEAEYWKSLAEGAVTKNGQKEKF